MRRLLCGLAVLLCLAAVSLHAAEVVLAEGAEVVVKLAQNVDPRVARPGETIEFVVDAGVRVAGAVVIPEGARAVGKVVAAQPKGMFGDTPTLEIALTAVKAGDTVVPLRGTLRTMGEALREGTVTRAYVSQATEMAGAGASAPPPEIPAGKLQVPNGKLVRLMLVSTISSKTAKAGDRVDFQVLDEVRAGALVVIARGAKGAGTVTEAKAAGRAWRKGSMGLKLEYVTLVNGAHAPIQFQSSASGGPTNAAMTWAGLVYVTRGLALFALPLAPLQHGEQAVMRKGMVVDAYLDGALLLDLPEIASAQPPAVEAKQGPSYVTLYYPDVDLPIAAWAWCGAVDIAWLPRGQRVTLQLEPGRYNFRLFRESPATSVEVTEGAEIYLRVGLSGPLGVEGTQAMFQLVHHDVGAAEVSDTKPMKAKKVRDLSQVKLSDLQAEGPPPVKSKKKK